MPSVFHIDNVLHVLEPMCFEKLIEFLVRALPRVSIIYILKMLTNIIIVWRAGV